MVCNPRGKAAPRSNNPEMQLYPEMSITLFAKPVNSAKRPASHARRTGRRFVAAGLKSNGRCALKDKVSRGHGRSPPHGHAVPLPKSQSTTRLRFDADLLNPALVLLDIRLIARRQVEEAVGIQVLVFLVVLVIVDRFGQ